MTSERRLAAFSLKASKHAKAHGSSEALAKDVLVKEGMYTKQGKLTRNYGGTTSKPRVAKKPA